MAAMNYEPYAGDRIESACAEAVRMAKAHNQNVEFKFNDQALTATPNSNPAAMAKAYLDESQRLSDEWRASAEYEKQQGEMKREQERKEAMLRNALVSAPKSMTLSNGDEWRAACEKNTDPYGACVMRYAEIWARIMEAKIAGGAALEDIAEEASRTADTEGITGFMYGCAVAMLARVWIHGEALRRWHNKAAQLGSEGDKANECGGVLNPALLVCMAQNNP